MDWRVRGAIQKALGYVPGGGRIHAQWQRRADFGRECDLAVGDWLRMVGHLRASGVALEGATVVEIGAGRMPAWAVCCYLAGARHVFALDRERRIEDDLVRDLADRLMVHVSAIARATGRSEPWISSAQRGLATSLDRGASLAVATDNVVDYRAPSDPAATALAAASIDIVASTSVLEHLPAAGVEAVFAEAKRLLRPGGVMIHAIHTSDHYATADRRLAPLRYLQFSDDEWARWNNAFLYQNRLRAKDFIDRVRAAGFTIELETPRHGELDGIRVHPRFAGYTREELEVIDLDVVARKP